MKLQPISFAWKEGSRQDVGFAAEDVAKIEPRLTFNNQKGEIEGVNYGQITTVLVNSIKEQQTQIEAQQKRIDEQKTQIRLSQEKLNRQQSEIDALRVLVCKTHRQAVVCKQEE
jgi:ABC-type Fe3+-citrate transport system substrate-binding protein